MPNFKHVNNGLIDSCGKLKCYKLSILESKVLWTSVKIMTKFYQKNNLEQRNLTKLLELGPSVFSKINQIWYTQLVLIH